MKKMKKLLLFLLTLIAVIGGTVAVSAAVTTPQYAKPTSLSVKWDKWTKVTKTTYDYAPSAVKNKAKITMYTNMTDAISATHPLGNPVVDEEGNITAYTFDVTYKWTTSWKEDMVEKAGKAEVEAAKEDYDDISGQLDPKVAVKSSNPAVASVASAIDAAEDVTATTSVSWSTKKVKEGGKKVTYYVPTLKRTYTFTGTITVVPKANGTTALSVTYDQYSKNKLKTTTLTKITVNVNTYADKINVANADEDLAVIMATNGTYALGASVNTDASNKGLKYTVKSGSKGLKVDSKGVVTAASSKVKEPQGTIVITSADKAVSTEVKVTTETVDIKKIGFGQTVFDTEGNAVSSQKAAALVLATNADLENHTAVVEAKKMSTAKVGTGKKKKTIDVYTPFSPEDPVVLYKSSNAAVAEVNPTTGEIVGKANGKATITAYLKYNNKVAGTIAVTVKTELSTMQASNAELIVGKTATIKPVINAGVSGAAYTYNVNKIIEPSLDEAGNVVFDYDNHEVYESKIEELNSAKKRAAFIKKYVVIDSKKGTVKAVKPCMVEIAVTAKAGTESITKNINVFVNAAADSVKAEIAEDAAFENVVEIKYDKKKKKNTTTFVVTSDEPQTYYLDATVSAKSTYSDAEKATVNPYYTVTSSNPAVVAVEEDETGVRLVTGTKGTATLTVTAADGSGKKFVVYATVTVNAYEITSAKAQENFFTEGFKDALTKQDLAYDAIYEYPVIVVKEAKNAKPATIIAAKTNATASNTGVAYYNLKDAKVSKFTLQEGEATVIVAKSADKNYEQGYIVYRPAKNVLATKSDVRFQTYIEGWNNDEQAVIPFYTCPDDSEEVSDDEMGEYAYISLTAGLSQQLYAEVALKDEAAGKLLTDVTAVTYATSNKKVATVSSTGLIKAVAPGYTKITAKYKTPGDGEYKVATADVFVGRSKSSVEATIDSAISAQVNGTDFSAIAGVKPTYNAKTKTMTVAINKPDVNVAEIQGVGAYSILSAIQNADYSLDFDGCYITIVKGEEVLTEMNLAACRTETGATEYFVWVGGDLEPKYVAHNYSELVNIVKTEIGATGLDKTTWLDWAGIKMYVDAFYLSNEEIVVPGQEENVIMSFGYDEGTHYTVDFTITDAVLNAEIDKQINAVMDDVDAYLEKYAANIPGTIAVDYNAATSTFTATIETTDADLTVGNVFDDMLEGREDLVRIFMNTVDGFSGNVSIAEGVLDGQVTATTEVNGAPFGTQTATVTFDGRYINIETSYDIDSLPENVADKIDRIENIEIRDERGAVTEDRVNSAIDRILKNDRVRARKISEVSEAHGIATVTFTVGDRTITKSYTIRLNVIAPQKEEAVVLADTVEVIETEAVETEEVETEEVETEVVETEEVETEEVETEEVETEESETEEVETEESETEVVETEESETEVVETEVVETEEAKTEEAPSETTEVVEE